MATFAAMVRAQAFDECIHRGPRLCTSDLAFFSFFYTLERIRMNLFFSL